MTFVNFVENELKKSSADRMSVNAIGSFLKSIRRMKGSSSNATDTAGVAVDERTLLNWAADMMLSGLKGTTRQRYISRLRSLYRSWSPEADVDPFVIPAGLPNDLSCGNPTEANNNLEVAERLLKKDDITVGREELQIFRYFLFRPDASTSDIVELQFDNLPADILQIDDIVDEIRRESGRTKYIFGLAQGRKRLPQIIRELTENLGAVLEMGGMKFSLTFSRESIRTIWIAAAIKAHIPYSDIVAILPSIPEEYAPLRLIKPSSLDDSQKSKILQIVADTISDHTSRWFVMRLRQGVSPDDVKQRISSSAHDGITFYYPTRTVLTKLSSGKKQRHEEPYLPGILFFRQKTDKVSRTMSTVGDLAWCYRQTNRPDAPYSTIPTTQMRQFQQTIGLLTPDISMELVNINRPLEPGRHVRITGGIFAGYEGEILDNGGEERIFRLRLTSNDAAQWQVSIPDIFIENAI